MAIRIFLDSNSSLNMPVALFSLFWCNLEGGKSGLFLL